MAVRCSRATVHWAPPDRRADEFWPDAPEGQARVAAFVQALQKLGWTDGDNVRTDVRWAAADMELFRKYAEELVELNPHVILASASPAVAELQRVTRSVPIVFANVVDPVGAGFIPGGKISNYLYYGRRVGGQDKRRG